MSLEEFGVKVMLTGNLWIMKGLCKGAIGIVKTIIYKEGQYHPVLPVTVLVEFQNYSGVTISRYYSNCFKRYYVRKSGKASITLKVMLGNNNS